MVPATLRTAARQRLASGAVRLPPVGLWTSALDRQPASVVREAVGEIEELGYGALWVGEAVRREAFANASLLLAASQRLIVATGIANIWARDPVTMAAGHRTLAEAWDERFVLGIGVSHAPLVNPRGHDYGKPLSMMRDYLDGMDLAPYEAPPPASTTRVLAALGPRMLSLAAERADGAHPYFVPVEHTAEARSVLGPGKLLCPEAAVVVEADPDTAREVARRHVGTYLKLPNYVNNLLRLGFNDADVAGAGSDRLVDALVGWGGVDTVAGRVRAHLDAGADHVAVQVLTADPTELPRREWRQLADALLP